MNASEFWQSVKTVSDNAARGYSAFRAGATSANSSGIQVQTLDSDTPMTERFMKLRGPAINPGDDVVVLPVGGSFVVVGALDNTAVESGSFLPLGGVSGSVLRKNSNANGDAGWHTLTPLDVGLGNVNNTSDLDKPISLAAQTALNAKAASNHSHTTTNVFANTHITTAATTPRIMPGTEHHALTSIPINQYMVSLANDTWVTSGGINWVQMFKPSHGVFWVNASHLAAI